MEKWGHPCPMDTFPVFSKIAQGQLYKMRGQLHVY